MFVRTVIRSVDKTEALLMSQPVVYMVTTHHISPVHLRGRGASPPFLEVEISDAFASKNNEDIQ